jgi:RNA polymerase sigma-70 factor (ECF subfamily)
VQLQDLSLPSSPMPRKKASADALLVEQIRRGDAAAGRRFVDAYYRDVYRYLLYLTGSPQAAEDLTQAGEARSWLGEGFPPSQRRGPGPGFVQAWRGLDALDERPFLRRWLHRIAHREFLQALRGQRYVASLDDVVEVAAPGAEALTDAVEVRELIRRLPLEEREVVVLHYLEGYRCEEIAQILGAPVGRVRHRLVEARARLRDELGEGR